MLLWVSLYGKTSTAEWPWIVEQIQKGYSVVSFDFRGTGEDRMRYQAASSDDLAFDGDPARAYFHPLSSVMACYVYNGIITGRPYFLQMIEDTEIVTRFAHQQLQAKNIAIVPAKDTQLLAGEIVKTLPDLTMADTTSGNVKSWSQRVMDLEEQWPVQYVLPGGAYIR